MDVATKESKDFADVLHTQIPEAARAYDACRPMALTISTMTVVCKSTLGTVNIATLRSYLVDNPDGIGKGLEMSAKTMGNNAVIMKWKKDVTRNISAKVFSTGCFHITGVKDPLEAAVISTFFCRQIDQITDASIASEFTDYTICMINSYFAIPFDVTLPRLRDCLKGADADVDIVHNPEKHPGLQLKLKAISTSVFVFSSGKIIVTGAKSPSDLLNAYKYICNVLEEHFVACCQEKQVHVKVKGKRGRKKKAEQDAFYNNTHMIRKLL